LQRRHCNRNPSHNRPVAANVLSTVINEILENAAKFSADKKRQVKIVVGQHGDAVQVEATNIATAERAQAFASRLEEVLAQDPEVLFQRHIESAASAPRGAPGVGLVVLRKDYHTEIAARIAATTGGLFEVTVQVRLPSEEVDP